VRVRLETQGRRGKAVTVIEGVPAAPAQLAELAARLKRRCGCGGSVKGGAIEIQGDQRETVIAELSGIGYTVRGRMKKEG
jgi:translation initiation factor 1